MEGLMLLPCLNEVGLLDSKGFVPRRLVCEEDRLSGEGNW